MVSFTYVPQDVSKIFQKEVWVKRIERIRTGPGNAFELLVPGIGHVKCGPDSTTEYELEHEDFSFHTKTKNRTPWELRKDTLEGLLVHLPLPLHWHVHSLSSDCDFSPSIPSQELPTVDRHGTAVVHQEKNRAKSFPKAHLDPSTGWCTKYLLCRRSDSRHASLSARIP